MLPKYVYLLHTSNPDDVFVSGIVPHGINMSIEDHITGASNYQLAERNLPINDGFISSRFTMLDCIINLQPYVNPNNIPEGMDYLWIYEIRPTQDFYSLERTANNFLWVLNNNHIDFPSQERRSELQNTFGTFVNESDTLYNEWFTTEPIDSNLIVRAFRVDLRRFEDGRPHVEFNNPHNNVNYIPAPANPNSAPYEREDMVNPISSNNNITAANLGDGYLGAGAANIFPSSNELLLKTKNNYLPIPKDRLIVSAKKDFTKYVEKVLSKPLTQDLPLIEIHNGHKGNLWLQGLWAIRNTYGVAGWTWTYDQHGRIGCYFKDKPFLFYCLTATNVKNYDWQYLNMMPAVIADKTQQWDLKLSDDKKTIKLINKAYPDMLIGSHYINFRDYLTIRKANSGKEEVRIEYDKLKDKTIFNKSYIPHNLYWFDLKWNNNGVFYYPILSGSTSSKREDAEILYFKDFSYIIYIQISNGKMWALTNKRQSQDDWSWIAWEEIDYKEFENLPTNPRRMWKIHNPSKDNVEISSYWNDDILWIEEKGVKWGSYFTSRKTSDYWLNSTKVHTACYDTFLNKNK